VPFVCNFVAAYMQINYGWGYAFAAAGVGMLIGVVVFMSGSKWVKHADIMKPLEPGDMSTSKILLSTLVPMFIFGVLGYLIPGNLLGTDTNDAFIFGCIPVVAFFIYLYVKANAEDKRPIGALLAVFGCLVIFWAVFHQNGDALTVWAKDYTNREMPLAVSNVGRPGRHGTNGNEQRRGHRP
jgi:POT family proton-dependent oligopeptide transporter